MLIGSATGKEGDLTNFDRFMTVVAVVAVIVFLGVCAYVGTAITEQNKHYFDKPCQVAPVKPCLCPSCGCPTGSCSRDSL